MRNKPPDPALVELYQHVLGDEEQEDTYGGVLGTGKKRKRNRRFGGPGSRSRGRGRAGATPISYGAAATGISQQ